MTFEPGRIHPDGAPGEAEAQMRKMYGDANYEAMRDASRNEQVLIERNLIVNIDLISARAALINALSALVVVATLVGVGLAVWAWV